MAAPAAAPLQTKTKSSSSHDGEKLQLQKKKSEKQSTDLDSKTRPTSATLSTTKRCALLPLLLRLLLLLLTRSLLSFSSLVVMFCDICDSTAMSEELDAEDIREVVLVYQQFVGEVLVSLDGHIAQYLGDGILTYFGFPESDPDAAQHAVEVGAC